MLETDMGQPFWLMSADRIVAKNEMPSILFG
jgi:hypothetical protein